MNQTRAGMDIPGLPPIPIVGGRLGLLRLFNDTVRVVQRLYDAHGPIAAVTEGDPSLVCAFGASYNQQFLSNAKQYHHFNNLPIKMPPNSSLARFHVNLTMMNGERHRCQRRLMMPAFHKPAVQSHRDDIVAVTELFLQRWAQRDTVDVLQEMKELTLTLMMKCLFGLDVGRDAQELGYLGMAFSQQITSLGVMLFPLNWSWTPYGRFIRFSEAFEQRLLNIIRQRRAQPTQAHDALSILIQTHDEDGSSLSDEELIGQTVLLFLAGHETTLYALSWTLILLTQHPSIYADLLDELHGKLRGDAPTIEQLAELPLLNAVAKESMRLLPPTPILFVREAKSPFQLGPYQLSTGTRVVLSPFITHRIEPIFQKPDQFQPRRWETIKPSPFEYLPFGTGPRMCLGASFADLEIRLILALIVQRFRLQLVENTPIDYQMRGLTLGPKRGVPMRVAIQDRNFAHPVPLTGSIGQLIREEEK